MHLCFGFSKDFAKAGHVWSKELCQKDSDKDGFTNGQELGDPGCTVRLCLILHTRIGTAVDALMHVYRGMCACVWGGVGCSRRVLVGV